MKHNQLKTETISLLQNNLTSGYYTSEELSKRFNIPRSEIQRTLQYLRIQPGWSIQIENYKPYWRRFGHTNYNRHRLKDSKYKHDFCESDWERTRYKIVKP
jgi:hypothetical protein